MNFKFTKLNEISYPINVCSLTDGIMALRLIFEQLRTIDIEYTVSILDPDLKVNGWAVEKYSNGYLFLFICIKPVNGFEYGDGSIYAFKEGDDPELSDWQSVEFGRIPRHCYIGKNKADTLINKLYRSSTAELSADFVFDSENWDVVSRVCL